MENNAISLEEIDFKNLFNNTEKTIKVNLKTKITNIMNVDAENILLEIQSSGSDIKIFKGLNIINGDIYPTPKKNNIIMINELAYKFDDKLNLRIFFKSRNI